jgi:methionyl-tRNA formyltransferase
MIIAICGSMVFTEKMVDIKNQLENLKHTALISDFAKDYYGKSLEDIEKLAIKDKKEKDAMKEFFKKIKKSDAILVLNYDKKGIKNYIGGNTLIEIGFAYILNKKIFLLNDIPNIDYYKSEIESVKPIIINGNLERIR